MEILKNIKSLYDTQEQDGFILLWSKTEKGKRYPNKFVCAIQELTVPFEGKRKKSVGTGFFTVVGSDLSPTKDCKTLIENIDKHVVSLPYDSEYYIPCLRKGLFEDFIIHDYLVYTLGFKSLGDSVYEMSQKNIYQFSSQKFTIFFDGLDAFQTLSYKNWYNSSALPSKVEIKLSTGNYSCIKVEVDRNVEAIKEGIDSILKPMLITDSIQSFNTSEKMKNFDLSPLELMLQSFNLKNGELLEANYKTALKNKLLEIVQTL